MLLGQLRGSIGDVVFARVDGQQVSRARNRKPNNPKTSEQVASRVFLKTASMAYSVLSASFANQTFQGSKIGAENQRRFISRNVALLRQHADDADYNFAASDAVAAPVNRYIVSEGSLTDPAPFNLTSSGFSVGNNSFSAANATYAEVCDAMGLPYGAQLTFVIVRGVADGYMGQVIRQRIILQPSTGDMSLPFLGTDGQPNMPNPANELTMMSITSGAGIAFATMASNIVAVACVASYYDGAKWQYSSSQMLYNGTGYLTLDAAVSSFQDNEARARLFPADTEYTQQNTTSVANLIDNTGDVSSMLLRVWQYDDDQGWPGTRKLVATMEVSGDTGTVVTTADDWNDDGTYNTVALEVNYYGTFPRSYTAEGNLSFSSPQAIDQSSALVPFKYTAGTKSYQFIGKLAPNSSGNQTIALLDNNGNSIAEATFTIVGVPVNRLVLSSVSLNSDGRSLTLTGHNFSGRGFVWADDSEGGNVRLEFEVLSNTVGLLRLLAPTNGQPAKLGNYTPMPIDNGLDVDLDVVASGTAYAEIESTATVHWYTTQASFPTV